MSTETTRSFSLSLQLYLFFIFLCIFLFFMSIFLYFPLYLTSLHTFLAFFYILSLFFPIFSSIFDFFYIFFASVCIQFVYFPLFSTVFDFYIYFAFLFYICFPCIWQGMHFYRPLISFITNIITQCRRRVKGKLIPLLFRWASRAVFKRVANPVITRALPEDVTEGRELSRRLCIIEQSAPADPSLLLLLHGNFIDVTKWNGDYKATCPPQKKIKSNTSLYVK